MVRKRHSFNQQLIISLYNSRTSLLRACGRPQSQEPGGEVSGEEVRKRQRLRELLPDRFLQPETRRRLLLVDPAR
eukprot:630027-Hanusia_phi.AAC.2